MRVITIARKPLSEGTVAKNTLKHGTGGLNIDACRLGFKSEDDMWKPGSSGGTIYHSYMDGSGQAYQDDQHEPTQNTAKPHTGGRWPTNLIFQHQPECRQVGGKRVQARPLNVAFSPSSIGGHKSGIYGGGEPRKICPYADKDGTERVANWICEPECPVVELEKQSGDRPVSGAAKSGFKTTAEVRAGATTIGVGMIGYGNMPNDHGTASRFFKQVGGGEE